LYIVIKTLTEPTRPQGPSGNRDGDAQPRLESESSSRSY
jgi:hypothetical protein